MLSKDFDIAFLPFFDRLRLETKHDVLINFIKLSSTKMQKAITRGAQRLARAAQIETPRTSFVCANCRRTARNASLKSPLSHNGTSPLAYDQDKKPARRRRVRNKSMYALRCRKHTTTSFLKRSRMDRPQRHLSHRTSDSYDESFCNCKQKSTRTSHRQTRSAKQKPRACG